MYSLLSDDEAIDAAIAGYSAEVCTVPDRILWFYDDFVSLRVALSVSSISAACFALKVIVRM